MNQSLEERLSALLDGELSALEQRSVISHAIREQEARETLYRYQLVGELLRGETGRASRPDFVAAVSAALEQEPTILAPRGIRHTRWVRRAYGLGLAASVAALAVTIGPRLLQTEEAALAQAQVAVVDQPTQEAVALAVAQPLPPPPAESALKPEMERKLNRYLVNHGEYAAASSMNRVLPYAAFVSYDKGR